MPTSFCYFDVPLGRDHIDSLMGVLVVNPTDPLEDARPDVQANPSLNPRSLVEYLRDKPVLFQDVEQVKNAAKSAEVKAKLGAIFEARASKSIENNSTYRMAVVNVYAMHQIKSRFKQLLGNSGYKDQVMELWSEQKGRHHRRLFLVTAMLTCQELVMETGKSKNRNAGGQIAAPLSEVFTLPVNIDPTIGASISKRKDGKVQGRIKDEVILAAAYHEVLEFEPFNDCFSFLWFMRKGALQTQLEIGKKHKDDGTSGIYLVHDQKVDDEDEEDEPFDLDELVLCDGPTYLRDAVPEIDAEEPSSSIDRNQPFRRVFVISKEDDTGE